jgi:hypothetical protein
MVPGGPAVLGAARVCDRIVMLGGCMYVVLLLSSRTAVSVLLRKYIA